jgi:hypothetical protein
MSAELIGWLAILCAPGIVPAVIFYGRHCKETPRGESRFPLGLAPKVSLTEAIAQIHDMEIRLELPATITTSLVKPE